MWFLLLYLSIPYTHALSQGLSVNWVPLPSSRSVSTPVTSPLFSQDGWGTDLGPPVTPEVTIQERLRRESASTVRGFVATSAYRNELVASYHLDDRTNKEAGLKSKRERREAKRKERDARQKRSTETSEPGWDTSDVDDEQPTGWSFPTSDGWTEIFINSDATTNQKLHLQSHCASTAFDAFVAQHWEQFHPDPPEVDDRVPPDKISKPVKILPEDVIRTHSRYDHSHVRRNKWGLPDL